MRVLQFASSVGLVKGAFREPGEQPALAKSHMSLALYRQRTVRL